MSIVVINLIGFTSVNPDLGNGRRLIILAWDRVYNPWICEGAIEQKTASRGIDQCQR